MLYEDIILWVVKDPKGGPRDVLRWGFSFDITRVQITSQNRKPPFHSRLFVVDMTDELDRTIFLFLESPLPVLCSISHILARAIGDNAVEVDGFTHAAPFFSTSISKRAVKVHCQRSILKTPVFRRSVRTAFRGWEKSETKPMRYSTDALS